MAIHPIDRNGVWLDEALADIAQLEVLCKQQTDPASVPLASGVVSEIPFYEGSDVRTAASASDGAPQRVRALQQEWARTLAHGAGVVLVRNAFEDIAVLDAVTDVFNALIESERTAGSGADHFAPKGSNTRLWNAHEKLCIDSPELFARYNANDVLTLMCRAWLGPGYQITTQGNIVHPGGQAQHCHRDYHMGFQQVEQLVQYPAHVHDLSPVLTLQGAVAHTDMSVESGPTKLLPFSQLYRPGYAAWRRADFRAYFEEHQVQLPLQKGDALFFSPALFHAAGANVSTDVHRMANLLQVSSAFGRAMEAVDRKGMSAQLFPVLAGMAKANELSPAQVAAAIAACAEGYSFPTNLDRDPPAGGLAPETQAALFHRALSESWDSARFKEALAAQDARRQS